MLPTHVVPYSAGGPSPPAFLFLGRSAMAFLLVICISLLLIQSFLAISFNFKRKHISYCLRKTINFKQELNAQPNPFE